MVEATRYCRDEAGWEARSQWFGAPLVQPVDVIVYVIWPLANSLGAERALPDVDGLGSYCKPYMDGLNKIVWKDDRQVQRIMFEQEIVNDDAWRNGAVGIMIYSHEPVKRRI